MVSMDGETQLVYDIKLSSVVPARAATGDDDVMELMPMDVAVKLHYIKGLYFFNSDAARGVDILYLKSFLFELLDTYHPASGRVRRWEEDSRPYIKCNDSGVRTVEAKCKKTVEEWLAMANKDHFAMNDQLVPSHVLGPDLGFSPLVYIQFTYFKCGGLSMGLSWAHILGDAFSLARFINMLGLFMEEGHHVRTFHQPLNYNTKAQFSHSIHNKPNSIKRVEPVGDYWLASTNDCKMKTHSFHVTDTKLDQMLSSSPQLSQYVRKAQYFHLITAIVWKSVSKTSVECRSRIVTICNNTWPKTGNKANLMNSQLIGSIGADFNVGETDILELVKLISEGAVDERGAIEEIVRESGNPDFILYGANLTFVNLEEEDIYGLRLQGKRPIFANYTISGVGKEGVVVVLPGPGGGKIGSCAGRTFIVTMPENKIVDLKNELGKEWGIY